MFVKFFFEAQRNTRIKNAIFISFGIFLFSIYAGLLVPFNNIGAGGALGISLVLNKLFNINIGTAQFIINVPLFYIAYKYLGRRFFCLTGTIVAISAFLINKIPKFINPVYLGDSLVAAIFCGIISGIAMSLLLIGGGSTGGTDITGKYISRKYKINLPTVFFVQDIIIYSIVWIIFDIKYVMYALIMSFVRNKTMMSFKRLLSAYVQCTIICDGSEALITEINRKLQRGSSIVNIKGGYSNKDKKMIILIVQRNEVPLLKDILANVSPDSFISITTVDMILGNFKEHSYSL